jgi:hypothetical protein
MTERNQAGDAERLPEEMARQLLARAGELEAAQGSEVSVAQLREAAREAGIAPAAFERALAELRERDTTLTAGASSSPNRRGLLIRFWPAALLVVALLSLIVLRLFPSAT